MMIKKKKFFAAMLTVLTASVVAPMGMGITAFATTTQLADGSVGKVDFSKDVYKSGIVFTEEACKGGCKGHTVTGTLNYSKDTYTTDHGIDGIYGIYVKSGTHKIYFNNVNMDFSAVSGTQGSAMRLGDNANVELYLEGKNELTSGEYRAGIGVPQSATLTISEGKEKGTATGSLDVKGGVVKGSSGSGSPSQITPDSVSQAAGIGGEGGAEAARAGNITIKSGTITAVGGTNSAGIGGAASGFSSITISGGKIKATGGSNASGIGWGNGGNGGEVKIEGTSKGNTVEAIGGLSTSSKDRISGIGTSSLSADIGNRVDVYTTGRMPGSTDTSNFNGVLWTYADEVTSDGTITGIVEPATTCSVYGHATLTEELKKYSSNKDAILMIPRDCSITIPSDEPGNWGFGGRISGSGSIINADKFVRDPTLVDRTIVEKVAFDPTQDVVIMEKVDFQYKDLTDIIITEKTERPRKNASTAELPFEIDKTGWERHIYHGTEEIVGAPTDKGMFDAATYDIRYDYKLGSDIDTTKRYEKRATVEPADFATKCTFSEIAGQDYTGEAIEPDVTVMFEKNLLTKGEDYTYACDYSGRGLEGAESIEAKVTLTPKSSNFTGKAVTIPFNINRASIESAQIVGVPEMPATYDGKPHKPEIEVRINETILTAGADYDAEWKSRNNDETFTDADTYTLTVTGKGNYVGTVQQSVAYTVQPKEVEAIGAKVREKQYDGTNNVMIEEVTLKPGDVLPEDEAYVKVEIPEAGIPAQILNTDGSLAINVGEYRRVRFSEVINLANSDSKNKKAHCYAVTTTELDIPEEESAARIVQRTAPQISSVNVDYWPDETQKQFNVTNSTIKTVFKSEIPSVEGYPDYPNGYPFVYEYNMDEGKTDEEKTEEGIEIGWQPLNENTIITVQPKSTHTFRVRATDPTGNIAQSIAVKADSDLAETYFDLKDRPAPADGSAVLSDPAAEGAYNSENGTYSLRINTELKDVEYSFDTGTDEEKKFGDDPMKTDCQPSTEYTGYVRYKQTEVYKASPSTPTAVVTTPKPKVDTPLIGDDGKEFRGSKVITISCRPIDAEIHYTTNGTDPSEATPNIIKSGESFTISGDALGVGDSIEVRAIAIRNGMDNSDIASATYEKTGEEEYRIRISLMEGISKEDITSGLRDVGYETAESIEARFRQVLSSFGFEDIAFYDMRVTRKIDGKWTKLTEKNFPEDGLTVTVDCPAGLSTESYDFAVSHMHAYDSDRLGVDAGTTEQPRVTKTEDGRLQFEITSASPLAIAWKTATPDNPDDPNNPDNPDDPNNPDNPTNPDDPNNTQDPTQDPNQTTTDPNNQSQGNDQTSNNRSGDQASGNGTTTGTNAGTQGASNDAAGTLSNLMPKTGDPLSFVPWIAAAVISIGAIAFFATRKNGKKVKAKKKQAVKKTQATKKKR